MERWGRCGFCRGTGERHERVPGSAQSLPSELTEPEAEELKLMGRKYERVETFTMKYTVRACGMCDGQGFSGDAMGDSGDRIGG